MYFVELLNIQLACKYSNLTWSWRVDNYTLTPLRVVATAVGPEPHSDVTIILTVLPSDDLPWNQTAIWTIAHVIANTVVASLRAQIQCLKS